MPSLQTSSLSLLLLRVLLLTPCYTAPSRPWPRGPTVCRVLVRVHGRHRLLFHRLRDDDDYTVTAVKGRDPPPRTATPLSRGRRLIIRSVRGELATPTVAASTTAVAADTERGWVCGKRARRRRPLFPCKTEASRRCRRLTRALQQKNNRAAPTVPNNHSLCDNIRSV